MRRLSDGGPDNPEHLAAICPNCHIEAHYGQNQHTLTKNSGS
ncbi:HNH endonuclease [Aneurinibacillus sp. Ricciae_BoGa-3]